MATHTVRTGDTLGAIARRHGSTIASLRELNPWIVDPDLIHPGQRIVLPDQLPRPDARATDRPDLLPGFMGDLAWVHHREGHSGRPYWPGGASGVTLDPGVDLGHCDVALVERLYGGLLRPEQLDALRRASGTRGDDARALLDGDGALGAIRITREQASALFPHAAAPYWHRLTTRFPALTRPATPRAVHTAFLSLGFNRGPGNRHLAVLAPLLEGRDWHGLARRIARMQQRHALVGIRRRRRMEAALIERELAAAATQRAHAVASATEAGGSV